MPDKLASVAFGPKGQRLAVLSANGIIQLYYTNNFRLDPGPTLRQLEITRYMQPSVRKVYVSHAHLGFLSERILLLSCDLSQYFDESAEQPSRGICTVAAIDIDLDRTVGEHKHLGTTSPVLQAPLPISPEYFLFVRDCTVECIEAATFQELFRVRQHDETGKVVGEEDCSGDEQVVTNGAVYDPTASKLYILWGLPYRCYLQSYHLEPDRRTFQRLGRREVTRGLSGKGLCMSPSGELAGWFTIVDEFLDLRKDQSAGLPETFLLGRLGVLSDQGDRFIDVHSAINRDFVYSPRSAGSPSGEMIDIGFRLGTDYHNAKPFYLDDHTVGLATPGGFLLAVDTVSGQSRVLHDFGEPIADLCFHPEKRLLVVGGESGKLMLFSA
jgi:hypothetical protein